MGGLWHCYTNMMCLSGASSKKAKVGKVLGRSWIGYPQSMCTAVTLQGIPAGYVKIAIERSHRNSEFSHLYWYWCSFTKGYFILHQRLCCFNYNTWSCSICNKLPEFVPSNSCGATHDSHSHPVLLGSRQMGCKWCSVLCRGVEASHRPQVIPWGFSSENLWECLNRMGLLCDSIPIRNLMNIFQGLWHMFIPIWR